MAPRRFAATRIPRLSECDPGRRLRLEAIAAWAQDIARDDVDDAGLTDDDGVWIVRRLTIEVSRWPQFGERCEVETWASGTGGTVAERVTSIAGGAVRTTGLWVATDRRSGRPMRLTERFMATYGESAAGRRVKSNLRHGEPDGGVVPRGWGMRYADLDIIGHVNNAAYFEAIEEVTEGAPPPRAEIEFRGGLTREGAVTLLIGDGALWFEQDGTVAASAAWAAN